MTTTETFNSVWDALADTSEQAANLQARAELMQQITAIINANDWKQADTATHVVLPSRALMTCYVVVCRSFHWLPCSILPLL